MCTAAARRPDLRITKITNRKRKTAAIRRRGNFAVAAKPHQDLQRIVKNPKYFRVYMSNSGDKRLIPIHEAVTLTGVALLHNKTKKFFTCFEAQKKIIFTFSIEGEN